jgi:hypothetical protein
MNIPWSLAIGLANAFRTKSKGKKKKFFVGGPKTFSALAKYLIILGGLRSMPGLLPSLACDNRETTETPTLKFTGGFPQLGQSH